MDHHLFICQEVMQPVRLDKFLSAALPNETRSAIQRLIDEGNVLVGGKEQRSSYRLKGGERIDVSIPPAVNIETLPEDIPLNVLYEDHDLIVIDKPAGMVVHPAAGNHSGTLVNALLSHCKDLSGIGGKLRPGIVHRLDKGTSGVIVAAKNDLAHQALAAQFSSHHIKRIYHAMVFGSPSQDSGRIEGNIGRHPTDRLRRSGSALYGKHAVTRWRVKERYERISLLEIRLETGRTHQIRAHLTEAGFPLLGDPLYPDGGRGNNLRDPLLRKMICSLGRQALHASTLGFMHPSTGQYLEFSTEFPCDIKQLIDYLKNCLSCSSH